MINRNIVEFGQRDAIQLVGYIESAVAHVVKFEVRLDFGLFQIVFLFAQFFGVVPPVPCFQFFAFALFVHQILQFGCFSFCFGQCVTP